MTPASRIAVVAVATCVLGHGADKAAAQAPVDAEAIVVGAGLSGLAAAVEMGRAGVDVLVVDMNSVMGGHAVMAGGFAIADTPLQQRLGYEDSPEQAIADWLEWTEDGDPEWTRFYAENSRELIYDWLAEMNVEFVRVQSGWENSVPRFHFTPRGALDVAR
jgi:predicted oxidoreductase